ncbi:MAG: Hydroxyacylglutathione hydrolase GloB [Chlamydiia bacterium]|nr:Hydroxyacylglutathione hydrolase GloB [Chlamydiia bacterium]MCH9615071.1 Hydroxyacylglutathione hydrolase GloB [Chlamydiia bacterium]MCH9628607.1 Hydroxyacylglutathione hydrolase GloB [Chlamydiia bacterium]
MPVHVDKIPALGDNYIYMLHWGENALVIDPGESESVIKALDGKRLRAILNTHHHSDHVDGNCALKKRTGAEVIAPDDGAIPGRDRIVRPKEKFQIGPYKFEVIATPGHTKGHVAFYMPDEGILFSGDTLFVSGCGRLFEGTPKEMFNSMKQLKKLPKETLIYCGHEYSEKNLNFAKSELAKKRLKKGPPYVPSTLEAELEYNPFLQAGSVEEFKELRERRDNY